VPTNGRKCPTLAAVTLTLVVLTSCSSSPKKATATLVASQSKIGVGSSVTLTGAVTKRTAGLIVHLESGSAGAYTATDQAASTDGSGAYSFTYKPSTAGVVTVRAEVTDGNKVIDSPDVSLTVLGATSVTAALSHAEVGLGKNASITGRVAPAITGRAVTLQTSPDGTTWTSTAATTTTDSSGGFDLMAPTAAAGSTRLRILAAESATDAEGTSVAVTLYVADYKAAGARYLACVKPGNSAGDKVNKASIAYNAGTFSFSDLKKSDAAYANALKAEITCFEGYSWPPSVAGLVKDIGLQAAVDADSETQVSHAKTLDVYNALSGAREVTAAATAASADAAKIRHGLGLPARS
jgi:hypothetical protein